METIFDYNPTPEEIGMILNPYVAITDKEQYLRFRDQEVCYRDLAVLMRLRGNKSKERQFLNKTSADLRRTYLLARKGF